MYFGMFPSEAFGFKCPEHHTMRTKQHERVRVDSALQGLGFGGVQAFV